MEPRKWNLLKNDYLLEFYYYLFMIWFELVFKMRKSFHSKAIQLQLLKL